MAKLYPPQLEGNLPAFSDQTNIIIPYTLNKTVSFNEIKGIRLMIKKVSSNLLVYEDEVNKTQGYIGENWVKFNIPVPNEVENNPLKRGQYYKFQIAFVNNEGVGYYSTPGIIKYISEPDTYILNLNEEMGNVNSTIFTGVFDPKDSGEFLYSSRFVLVSDGVNLIDSGEILHNNSDVDKDGKSTEIFKLNYNLLPNKKYYFQYTTTTGNGFVQDSPRYLLVNAPMPQPNIEAELVATNDYENGCINLSLKGILDSSGNYTNATGTFNIVRAKSTDNYTLWEQVIKFNLADEQPVKSLLYRDYYVEHGVTYLYALQQYNTYNFYSKKKYSEFVTSEFEDTFLVDIKRQLNIKFNPKISSFKTTLLESKVDTIGGQYPFIFRNGDVRYKEFPISGLISYLSDPYNLFMEEKELKNGLVESTELTDENIYLERKFKNTVYDWLTNGEVKYFKSPVEGSFLVRLMNVSLTPNDQLGRMLHTFSGTAYEISDTSEEQMVYYHLKDLDKTLPASGISILSVINMNEPKTFTNVKNIQMYNIGAQKIEIKQNNEIIANLQFTTNQTSYFLDLPLEGEIIINPIGGTKASPGIGNLIVTYQKEILPTDTIYNNFNKITGVEIDPNITINQIKNNSTKINEYITNNIINILEYINNIDIGANSNKELSSFSFLQFSINEDYIPTNNTRNTCYKIYINNTEIDISQTQEYLLRNFDVTSLKVGLGIVVDCGYYAQKIVYES